MAVEEGFRLFVDDLDGDDEQVWLQDNMVNYPSTWEVVLGREFNPDDHLVNGIFNKIASFLSVKELKKLRQVSRACYLRTTRSPKFVQNVVLKLRPLSFYSDLKHRNVDMSLAAWEFVHLRHFNFHKRRADFLTCWKRSMENVKELAISSGAMECDGFGYLLNHCRRLKALRIYDNVRLRDINVAHSATVGMGMYPRVQSGYDPFGFTHDVATPEEDMNMRFAFKNLDITGINLMEDCFTAHLVDRTGWLESLTIGHMFHDLRGIHPGGGCASCPDIGLMKTAFENRMIHIIQINAGTLRKLTIDCNANQDELITKLNLPVHFPPNLRLSHLILNLNARDEPEMYEGFMENVAGTLETLELGFKGEFTTESLANFIVPKMFNLIEFKLTFDGAENRRNRVSLQVLGAHAPNLRRLEIEDRKEVKPKFLRIARGITGRRQGGARPEQQEQTKMRNEISSCIALNFFADLHMALTELSFNGLVIPDPANDISNVSILRRIQNYRNMTKLEIRGPILQSGIQGVRVITRELVRLQELTLTNVGLTDAELTGLSNASVQTLRRSTIYGAFDRQEVRPLLEGLIPRLRPVRPGPPNVPRMWPDGEEVFSFSRLTDLWKLDLSGNYGVSDVTLFFGMFEPSPRLTHLNLSSCKLVTDIGLEMLARRFPNIENLDVRYIYKVTYFAMDKVIRQCARLKRIDTSVSPRMNGAGSVGLIPSFSNNFGSIVHICTSPADVRLELAELLREEREEEERANNAHQSDHEEEDDEEDEDDEDDEMGGEGDDPPRQVVQ